MKIILFVIGSLAGLYSVFAVIQFIGTLTSTASDANLGAAQIAASLVPVCLGLVICILCFQRALRKRN